MEKVSIIVPCYNGEKFIDRCIESIYKQSYPSIELIVVDDGSIDRSKEKIFAWKMPFLKRGFELKYLYQKNQGPGSAVNAGLKLVSGDFISLLDADDEYLSGAIDERVSYLQEHGDVDVVRSNGWIVRENNRFLFINSQEEKNIEDVFLALLRGETNNWAGSFMVRSKALFQFYPEKEIFQSKYGQNLQFLLPLLYKKKCGYIDRPHMNYIQLDNSLCRINDRNIAEKKSIENANGYREIRMHMVGEIVLESSEQQYYLNMIECGYWKSIMNIASLNYNKPLMKNAYENKCKYEKPTMEDKIFYYQLINPYHAIWLRLIRKIVLLLK